MVLGMLRRRSEGDGEAGSGPEPAQGSLPQLPPGAGAVSCTVLDPFGQPLSGAEIVVSEAGSRRKAVSGSTDPYGSFFATLPPGSYVFALTAEGLQPLRASFSVEPGSTASLGLVQTRTAALKELPPPGTWLIDPPHTEIRFVARHVGMANVTGRFTRFQGGLRVADRMEDSQIEISMLAASIDTGNRTRDNHLRSADFLDIERYPYVHFASDRFVFRGGSRWTVQGSLTLHGVTRSVELETEYLGTVTGGYADELRCAARATAELHRDDFTLDYRRMLARGIAVVGPRIKLEIDIQAMYQTPTTPVPPE